MKTGTIKALLRVTKRQDNEIQPHFAGLNCEMYAYFRSDKSRGQDIQAVRTCALTLILQ